MLQTGRYAFFDKEEMIPVKKFLTQLDAASLGVLECKLWVQQSSSAKAARVKGIADRLDIDACAAVSVSRFLNALQDGQINDLRKIMFEGDGVCSRASCQREVLQWVYEVMVSTHLKGTSPSCMATPKGATGSQFCSQSIWSCLTVILVATNSPSMSGAQ